MANNLKGDCLDMQIFGLKCLLCSGELETLQVLNGTIHTRCVSCGYVARPEAKGVKNKAYSNFNKKTVDIEYSRPKPKSGTFNRVSAPIKKYG